MFFFRAFKALANRSYRSTVKTLPAILPEPWAVIPKEERKRITINGEPVVELDIKSCHATMAFAHVGIDWYAQSNQDLYSRLEDEGWPRDVVKKAFNIMMNAKSIKAAIGSLNYE